MAREVAAVTEAELMGMTGRHAPVEPEAPRGLHPEAFKTVIEEAQRVGREDRMRDQIQDAFRFVEPYLKSGEAPPHGVNPLVDKLYDEEAKQSQKALDRLVKENQATETFQTPGDRDGMWGWTGFLNSHPNVRGRMIGISPEGLDLVYPEGKEPEFGDGVLGDVPGIKEKVARARDRGVGIEVPLRDIVLADPEAYRELRDHIRSWPGGRTVEETKVAPEAGTPVTHLKPEEEIKLEEVTDKIPTTREYVAARQRGEPPPDITALWRAGLAQNRPEGQRVFNFDIGDQRGQVKISPETDPRTGEQNLYIDSIGPRAGHPLRETAPGKGMFELNLGTQHMLALAQKFKEIFPEAKTVSGMRVSGARGKFRTAKTVTREIPDLGSVGSTINDVRQGAGLTMWPAGPEEAWPGSIGERAQLHVDMRPENAEGPSKFKYNLGPYKGKEFQASSSFRAADILDKLDPQMLTGPPAALQKFFGNRLKRLVGDYKIYTVPERNVAHITGQNWRAFHSAGAKYIVLPDYLVNGEAPQWEATHVIMEEISHAATSMAIFNNPELKGKVDVVRNYLRQNMGVREQQAWEYALSDPHETVAWSQAHAGFQAALAKVTLDEPTKAKLGFGPGPMTAWEAVRQIVRRLWAGIIGRPPPDTVLDAMFRIGEDIEKYMKADPGMREWMERPSGAPERPIPTKKEHRQLMEALAKEVEGDLEFMRKTGEREVRERQGKEWKANEDRVRGEVETYLNNLPDIAADRFLREGRLYEAKVRRMRLDEGLLTDEQKAVLSPEHYGPQGLDPDSVAETFGYRSGDSMINALAALEEERELNGLTPKAHYNQMREAETERRMKAQYGKPEENVLLELIDHVLGPTTMDRLEAQIENHRREYGVSPAKEGPVTRAEVEAWAEEERGRTPVEELGFSKHIADSERLGAKVRQALLDGKHGEALERMIDQFKAAALAKLAVGYEKERAASDRLVERDSKRVVPGRAEEWVNFIHQQLVKAGVEVRRTEADLYERMSKFPSDRDFTAFAERMQSHDGYPMNFDPMFFDPNFKKLQDKMTYDEWKAWSGGIKTLDAYAKNANKFRLQEEMKDLDALRTDLIDQAERERFTKPGAYVYNKSAFRKLVGDAQRIHYKLVLMDSVWQRFDHGDPYGLFQRSFGYDAADHIGQFGVWLRDFSKELEKLKEFDTNLRKKVENSLFVHPRTREPIDMTKENVRKVIDYLGTKSGENVLIRGWILDQKYSKTDYAVAKQALYNWLAKVSDKKDWDFAQAKWDLHEKIFEKYEKMVTNLDAVPAQRERLNPITIHGKTYKGGYAKLQYDPDIEGTSKKLMGTFDPEDAMGDSGFMRASTPRSHEKRRTGYAGPLYLKQDRDAAIMSNILRDAAVRPFVINAGKLFYDNAFRDAMARYGGDHIREMLDTYLKSVAGMGPKMNRSDRAVDKFINYLVGNTVARLIGWNPHTISKHALSAGVNSLGEVGAMNVAYEMRHIHDIGDLHPTMSNNDFAMRTSRELPNRLRMAAGSMSGQWEERIGVSTRRERFQEMTAAPIGFFDLKTAVPTWTAAYKKSLEDQVTKFGDVSKDLAVQVADRAVRRAHGSTLVSARPEAMQGGALARSFTRLYLFFNTMWQRNYEAYWRSKAMVSEFGDFAKTQDSEAFKRGLAEGRTAIKLLVMANIAPALIEEWITPYSGHEHDNWGTWAGKTLLMMMSGMIPIVREAVHAYVGGWPSTLGQLDTALGGLSKVVQDLREHHPMDAQHGGKTIKDFNSLAGTLTGYTNDEIGAVMKWGWDVAHPNRDTPHTLYEHGAELRLPFLHAKEHKR